MDSLNEVAIEVAIEVETKLNEVVVKTLEKLDEINP